MTIYCKGAYLFCMFSSLFTLHSKPMEIRDEFVFPDSPCLFDKSCLFASQRDRERKLKRERERESMCVRMGFGLMWNSMHRRICVANRSNRSISYRHLSLCSVDTKSQASYRIVSFCDLISYMLTHLCLLRFNNSTRFSFYISSNCRNYRGRRLPLEQTFGRCS